MQNSNRIFIFSILVFLISLPVIAQGDPELVGKWVMEDKTKGITITMEFSFNTYTNISQLGEQHIIEKGDYIVDNGTIHFIPADSQERETAKYRVEMGTKLILTIPQGEIVFLRKD